MAEARSIQVLGDELKRGVHLASLVDEEGLHLRFDCTVPPPRQCLRMTLRRLDGARRWLYYSVFPHGLSVMLAVVALVVGVVLRSPADSWWRNGWLAWAVWEIGAWFPWLHDVPHELRVGILAGWAGLIGFILLATLQRFILGMLLSWKGFLYAGHKPSVWVRAWFAVVRLMSGLASKPLIYAFQSALPRLPVPRLDDTVRRYLTSVRPLMSEADFAKAETQAAKFLTTEGPQLQRFLHLKWLISSNYVSDWWQDYVYLKGRSPIMINSNYYVLDSATWTPSRNQIARAAVLTWSFARYCEALDREELEPTLIQDAVPLCMHQFQRIFRTTRLPGREMDSIQHLDAEQSRHVAVRAKGHWYSVPVFSRDGALLSPLSIEAMLREVAADAASRPAASAPERALPSLTAWNRTRWAEARERYFGEGQNRRSLHAIESALFVVNLSDKEFEFLNWTDRGRDLLCGGEDGSDCWFDKSFNMIVYKNGKLGLNAEHSWADAPVMAHVMEVAHIVNESRLAPYAADGTIRKDLIVSGEDAMGSFETCERTAADKWSFIDWSFTDGAKATILEASDDARRLQEDLHLEVRCFDEYGKGFMKRCSVSPDAYVQMAMQLAYYEDQGHFDDTYESSMTRLFLHGRTETIRSVSSESCAFVRSMLDDKAPATSKLELLQKAAARHTRTTQDSMAGVGVDRHLFALYVVSVGKSIESDFLRGALSRSWRLSTSQQPQQQTTMWDIKDPKNAHLVSPGGGFGPVTDDGYGVSYMVAGEDRVFFHVSSKRSSPRSDSTKFVERIFEAMRRMKSILELALPAKPAKGSKAE